MKTTLDISKIRQYPLPATKYFAEESPKKQIYLHHTVSHPNAMNVIAGWKLGEYRIATAFVIAGTPYATDKGFVDGEIFQAFPSKYWALHLASHGSGNQIPAKYKTKEITRALEKAAVGIEICNAGSLTYKDKKFFSSFNKEVPANQVVEYVDKYKGVQFYHRYSDAQIEMTRQLLVFLCEKYGIPMTYNADMWNITEKALAGEPGIFTHTSVRSDKSDCHPQPELVKMLMELAPVVDTPAITDANGNTIEKVVVPVENTNTEVTPSTEENSSSNSDAFNNPTVIDDKISG